MTTLALGTTAPVESVTVPRIVPNVVPCPNRFIPVKRRSESKIMEYLCIPASLHAVDSNTSETANSSYGQRPKVVPPVLAASFDCETDGGHLRSGIEQCDPQAVIAWRKSIRHIEGVFEDRIAGQPLAHIGARPCDRAPTGGAKLEGEDVLAIHRRDPFVHPPACDGHHGTGMHVALVLEAAQGEAITHLCLELVEDG